MTPTEFGLIITDNNGKITQHNEMAEIFLQEANLDGRPVRPFLSALNSMGAQRTVIGDNVAYLLTDANYRLLDHVLKLNSSAFAVSSEKGSLIYYNSLFLSYFSGGNDEWLPGISVDDLFKRYCREWAGLKLIQKAKKEVAIKIKINGQSNIVLFKPIYDRDGQISCILIHCSYSNEMDYLKKEVSELQKEIAVFKSENRSENSQEKPTLIMHSKRMEEINLLVQNLAPKDITILLLGKSGTGKSSLARTIHKQSMRERKPFITINCSAIPDSLIESELFGYEKGAFTGALSSGKKGLVEMADGGTLFLDEIADMPYSMQSKLLQLIQEKTFTPVGGTGIKEVDIRIIAATNRDLHEAVKNGTFREDLYYRIAVAVIHLPPLSDRKEDLDLTINTFFEYFGRKHNKIIVMTQQAKHVLINYSWPGNIRELEHLLEFLVLSNDNDIDAEDLPFNILQEANQQGEAADRDSSAESEHGRSHSPSEEAPAFDRITDFDEAIEEYECKLIRHFYKTHNSSYKLAKGLSLSQTKANRLIQKYINHKATT